MNAVRDKIGPGTCGIIVEPIQGEGGVRAADPRFLRDLRAVCDEHDIILGMDEVQSGMGRTGKLFAHEWAGITPDVMSAAKGIGGGFPLGAVLAKERYAKALVPGTHGTTYGGNPLACAAGNAVLDVILAPGFLQEVGAQGQQARRRTGKDRQGIPDGVRGRARHGSVARPEMRHAAGRGAAGLRRRGPDGDHRRGERAASGAASGGDGRGSRPGGRHAAPGRRELRRRSGQGSGPMSASLRRRGADRSAVAETGPRHFLDLRDFDTATLRQMLDVAAHYKKARGVPSRPLTGKTLALIFEKPSTRTRVSFEVGMRQLGGDVIVLSAADMQTSRGESPSDTARVLSRYVDAIMLRTADAAKLHELAKIRDGAGDQRSDRHLASLPVDGGCADVRGTPRADRRSGGGLVRRRQQRRAQLDRGGGAVRLHPAPRHAGCAAPAART